jgi:hypothetical protein
MSLTRWRLVVAATIASTVLAASQAAAVPRPERAPATLPSSVTTEASPATALASSSFVPLPGVPRLLITRVSTGPIRGGDTVDVQVTGRGGIPSTGVSAVVLTLEAYLAEHSGWAVVYPAGDPRPATSTVNYVPGRGTANSAVVPVGVDGKVTIYASATSQFHLAAQGYYLGSPAYVPVSSAYVPVRPTRVLDTRHGLGAAEAPVAGGTSLPLTVAGTAGVPADAAAVVLNVTVPKPHARGFVTVYPDGSPRPWSSAINFGRDQTLAGMVVAKVGDGGQVDLYTSATTNLVADVLGWVPAGSSYYPLTPRRSMDTKTGLGDPIVWHPWDDGVGPATATDPWTVAGFELAGRAGVPADAAAVLVTVTIVGAPTKGSSVAYPVGASLPMGRTLSFVPGEAIASTAVVVPGRDGRVRVFATCKPGRMIVDVVGYWAALVPKVTHTS